MLRTKLLEGVGSSHLCISSLVAGSQFDYISHLGWLSNTELREFDVCAKKQASHIDVYFIMSSLYEVVVFHPRCSVYQAFIVLRNLGCNVSAKGEWLLPQFLLSSEPVMKHIQCLSSIFQTPEGP